MVRGTDGYSKTRWLECADFSLLLPNANCARSAKQHSVEFEMWRTDLPNEKRGFAFKFCSAMILYECVRVAMTNPHKRTQYDYWVVHQKLCWRMNTVNNKQPWREHMNKCTNVNVKSERNEKWLRGSWEVHECVAVCACMFCCVIQVYFVLNNVIKLTSKWFLELYVLNITQTDRMRAIICIVRYDIRRCRFDFVT